MIDSKWFLFATNSAAVVIAFFEGIPFSFSVLTGSTFFNCVSSGLMVSNILWVTFTIINELETKRVRLRMVPLLRVQDG